MKKILFLTLATILLQSCTNTSPASRTETASIKTNRLESISSLLGSWIMETPNGVLMENWEAGNGGELKGISMMLSSKGDTLFSEKLRLVSKNDTLWYMPTVSNQNDGKEVSFKEKEITATKLVFENMEHDFPQRIVYELTSDSTILAYIEGLQNGKMRREEFSYKRK